MTKHIEALKLALEELENCADLLKAFEAPIDSCVGAAMLGAEKAANAIKAALEAHKALMSLQDGTQPAVASEHEPMTEDEIQRMAYGFKAAQTLGQSFYAVVRATELFHGIRKE